ncbi:membrane protein [Bacteroidia bacterium]|nr:membrane protein [Bacteroidia bacterium]GHT28693.1 membrane protein [Bacteroidia bacterium]GHT85033.1 membrane protein [Bacteroidia bacterium]
MMKQIFIISLLLSGFSLAAFAQKDAKAKELLDKSSATFSQSGDLSVSFTMNVKDAANKTTESFDGQISLKKNKFLIEIPGRDIYFDGKTQWVHDKSYEEVNISEPDDKEVQTLNPAFIFEMYKKGCDYKYTGAKTDTKMRKVQEVALFPKDKKGDITRIDLQINEIDFMPVFIHIFYKNKLENIIYINKYQTKLNLSDGLFVFDTKKHPGVEVIDLR